MGSSNRKLKRQNRYMSRNGEDISEDEDIIDPAEGNFGDISPEWDNWDEEYSDSEQSENEEYKSLNPVEVSKRDDRKGNIKEPPTLSKKSVPNRKNAEASTSKRGQNSMVQGQLKLPP